MHSMRRTAALLGALALVLGLAPLDAVPAAAAPEHRALIVVDTGSTVIRRTITFSEDSISGIAALQRAGADPVVYTYAGQGGAVCRLFGVGRDAGPGCLGGAGGDHRDGDDGTTAQPAAGRGGHLAHGAEAYGPMPHLPHRRTARVVGSSPCGAHGHGRCPWCSGRSPWRC